MKTAFLSFSTGCRRRQLLFVAYLIGLFAVFYCYVLLRIRPELFYHQNPLIFLFDYGFFCGFMDRPGGLVEYISAFLSPLFFRGWLGALAVTALTAMICLATRQFTMAVAEAGGQVVFLVPAVLILMLLGQYVHPVRLCVGLGVVLVFASGYVRLGRRRVAVRLTAFAIAAALVYYMAAGLYVVFACLCGAFELGVKRHFWPGTTCVLSAMVVPIAAGGWLLDLSLMEAYRGLMLPNEQHWLATPSSIPISMTIRTGLLLFFPVAAIALAWRRHAVGLSVAEPEDHIGRKAGADAGDGSDRPVSRVRLAVQLAVLVVLVVGAAVVSFDFPKRCLLDMAYGAEQRRWADVLGHARRLTPSDVRAWDPRIVSHVNRALYFRGELLDRMFAYPQALDTPSLALVYESATTMAESTPRQCSEILFELGRINESEHMAYEALEVYGDRPRILKRLALINVIKGEPEAARRFLALLQRSMLHGRWARACSRQLDADPTLSGVPVVASRRELTVVRDSVDNAARLETMLVQLLDRNYRNRMAFEYLTAHYLLTRQLDKLAANLGRLDDFDYPGFPRHCEEAMVIYLASSGSPDFDFGKRRISLDTQRRFREFVNTERRLREDPSAAFAALYPDFGDSYFFCYVFGHNDPTVEPSRSSK